MQGASAGACCRLRPCASAPARRRRSMAGSSGSRCGRFGRVFMPPKAVDAGRSRSVSWVSRIPSALGAEPIYPRGRLRPDRHDAHSPLISGAHALRSTRSPGDRRGPRAFAPPRCQALSAPLELRRDGVAGRCAIGRANPGRMADHRHHFRDQPAARFVWPAMRPRCETSPPSPGGSHSWTTAIEPMAGVARRRGSASRAVARALVRYERLSLATSRLRVAPCLGLEYAPQMLGYWTAMSALWRDLDHRIKRRA